jgi:hypothetical protein
MQAIVKDEGCGVALNAMSLAANTGKEVRHETDWSIAVVRPR